MPSSLARLYLLFAPEAQPDGSQTCNVWNTQHKDVRVEDAARTSGPLSERERLLDRYRTLHVRLPSARRLAADKAMFNQLLTAVRLAVGLLLITTGAQAAAAAPLSDYSQRVHMASIQLNSLLQWNKVKEDEQLHATRMASILSEVRKDLPPQETIEWNGTTIRVDNAWLDEALTDYEKLSASDPRRTETLARITERLYALDGRLQEIEAGKQSAAAVDKDADQRRLAAILSRVEYQKKPVEKGMLARLWERFMKWLESIFPESKPLQPGESGARSRLAEIIVVALALAVITYAVWKFVPRLLHRRGGAKGNAKRGARVVLGETLTADQTASDLIGEAEALARAGHLRAAIRKGYIALLCELGDRKILSLAQHKTNRDYLRAVQDQSALHSEMQQLTTSFENHWYGFQAATPDDWAAFRDRYHKAVASSQ
jgi:hypothetical protein